MKHPKIVSEARAPYGLKPADPIDRLAVRSWRSSRHRMTEAQYLALDTMEFIEFTDGVVEYLPVPNELHQLSICHIMCLLNAFVLNGTRGITLFGPFKLKMNVNSTQYREPDIAYLLNRNDSRRGSEFWTGADLVMEIVSRGGRKRDLVDKRKLYAEAGIPEYWIIDPKFETITVLKLSGCKYVEHGVFKKGEQASSALLTGFKVDVSSVLKAN